MMVSFQSEGWVYTKKLAKAVKEALDRGIDVSIELPMALNIILNQIGKDDIPVEEDREIKLLCISKEDIEFSLGIKPLTDEEWQELEEDLYYIAEDIDKILEMPRASIELSEKMNSFLFLYIKTSLKENTTQHFANLKSLIITRLIRKNKNKEFFKQKVKEANNLIENYLKQFSIETDYFNVVIGKDEERITLPRNALKDGTYVYYLPSRVKPEFKRNLLKIFVMLNEK